MKNIENLKKYHQMQPTELAKEIKAESENYSRLKTAIKLKKEKNFKKLWQSRKKVAQMLTIMREIFAKDIKNDKK